MANNEKNFSEADKSKARKKICFRCKSIVEIDVPLTKMGQVELYAPHVSHNKQTPTIVVAYKCPMCGQFEFFS